MENLIYTFKENKVRVLVKNNEPWFVSKDVCDVLEIKNNRDALSKLEEDEKGVEIYDTLGGKQSLTVVNESGLYELVFTSRKPEAKEFKKWLKQEVIPSIRKNGAYMTPITLEKAVSDPDFMIGLLQKLKQQQEEINQKQEENMMLVNKVSSDAPKVFFAEAVAESDNTISVAEMAKLISQNGYLIGQNRLFQYLRDNGYLIKRHGIDYNTPQQRYVEKGLFKIKESVTVNKDESKVHRTTRITGKGQQYFINRFLNTDLPLKGDN